MRGIRSDHHPAHFRSGARSYLVMDWGAVDVVGRRRHCMMH